MYKIMNEHMKLLSDLNKMWIPDSGKDIKWVVSQHDDTYFAECVKYLKSLGVHNVLDILLTKKVRVLLIRNCRLLN